MFKKFFVIIVALTIVISGVVNINVINTQALSPLGNAEDNYKIVSEEFGDDFSEFINDKSPVKIYLDKDNENNATIEVLGKSINLTKDNFFVNFIEKVAEKTKTTTITIYNKILDFIDKGKTTINNIKEKI